MTGICNVSGSYIISLVQDLEIFRDEWRSEKILDPLDLEINKNYYLRINSLYNDNLDLEKFYVSNIEMEKNDEVIFGAFNSKRERKKIVYEFKNKRFVLMH